jgi:hypothetical protein
MEENHALEFHNLGRWLGKLIQLRIVYKILEPLQEVVKIVQQFVACSLEEGVRSQKFVLQHKVCKQQVFL